MRRVLAVLGAVGMVAAAVLLRGAIDDSDEPSRPDDGEIVLACDAELADVCEAVPGVTVRVADSADTSAAIVAGEDGEIDAWVTSSAWVEVAAGRDAVDLDDAIPLATSRVLVAVAPERSEAVRRHCEAKPLLRCLGDDAEMPWSELGGDAAWGPLRTGLPDADSATGLAVLASAALAHFGDPEFATNDFESTGFRSWLDGITEASGDGDVDPAATLVRVQGTYTAAGTTEARLSTITRPVEPLDANPTVTASIVLVSLDGRTRDLAEGLRGALAREGWNPSEEDVVALLKEGVMGALYDLWKDVTR